MKKTVKLMEQVRATDPIRDENLDRSAEEESATRMLAAILAQERKSENLVGRHRVARRYLAFGAAVATAVALFLIVLGSGEAPTGNSAFARGVELMRLARISPHLLMVGPGWHVIGVEATSKVEGHTEFFLGKAPADPSHFNRGRIVEFRWRSISQNERARELRANGFAMAGVHEDFFTGLALLEKKPERTPQVYVPRNRGGGSFAVVGLWQQDGRAFELRSHAPSVPFFERNLERFVPVNVGRWISALEPSLAESIDKVEVVQRGKTPDGRPAYTRKGSLSAPDIHLKFTHPKLYRRLARESLEEAAAPLPLIHRNGRVTLNPGWLSIHGSGNRIRAMARGYGQLWRPPSPDAGP